MEGGMLASRWREGSMQFCRLDLARAGLFIAW